MVDMEMVDTDMEDMDMVDMDMVDNDINLGRLPWIYRKFLVNFIYLGLLPRIISRTCPDSLVLFSTSEINSNESIVHGSETKPAATGETNPCVPDLTTEEENPKLPGVWSPFLFQDIVP